MGRIKLALSKLVLWILEHPLVAFVVASVLIAVFYLLLRQLIPAYIDFADSAFGGLVASLGTAAFIRQFVLHRETFGIKKWLSFSQQNIWVIPTYLDHPSNRYPQMKYYVVPALDAQAAGLLIEVMRMGDVHHPRRRLVGSHRFSKSVLRDNLVMLCLPERNQYTRVFLGLYHEIYIEHRDIQLVIKDENIDAYIDDVSCNRTYFGLKWEQSDPQNLEFRECKVRHFGEREEMGWFRSSINIHHSKNVQQPGIINYDYAMIVKGPNPFNLASSVLIVCGIHGIGTFAGALYVYQNAKDLFGKYPEHAQAQLIEVLYQTPQGVDNYVDAEILSIKEKHYMPLAS